MKGESVERGLAVGEVVAREPLRKKNGRPFRSVSIKILNPIKLHLSCTSYFIVLVLFLCLSIFL